MGNKGSTLLHSQKGGENTNYKDKHTKHMRLSICGRCSACSMAFHSVLKRCSYIKHHGGPLSPKLVAMSCLGSYKLKSKD